MSKWWKRLKVMLAFNLYEALAFPLSIAELLLPLFGKAEAAKEAQLKAAELLPPPPRPVTSAPSKSVAAQTVKHGAVSLVVNLIGFVLIVPLWGVFITRGFLYPVFGADNLEQSWGGPTLIGAWIAHFIQGPPLVIVVSLLLWPLVKLQSRWIVKYLQK